MRDLSSNQINFERERDPVGEKTTKIGTHKGGRPEAAAPIIYFLLFIFIINFIFNNIINEIICIVY